MLEFKRKIKLKELLQKKSFFLFGPRSVGKTFLIHQQLPQAKVYDLLNAETYGRFARHPQLLEEEHHPKDNLIVIDEIQRLPILLNEVQRLIQSKGIKFLLTGSSARKLRKGGTNLLGGRAWTSSLFPLCFLEIPDFNLTTYFNKGGLPPVTLSSYPEEELRNYVDLYLREEVQAEALTRNIGSFARFLDVLALQNGEELNYQGISSDAGVPARTIQNYIQILEDTLLGFQVPAFRKTSIRKAITRAKFFFFDIGVVNALAHRGQIKPKSDLFGRCFEHFLIMELRAYLSYHRVDESIQYWRSTSGYKVDCIIGSRLALEFKATEMVTQRHLKGLKALEEEKLIKKHGIISLDPNKRKMGPIEVYPWREFLTDLWKGEIL